ncbi:hypothetical protein P280DRAFT_545741 [Massarina eburnea CBS 473.64]|uniref:Rhodopsin domain-containing protein n=1 Tax=Massarina eburnea CBS 473.64 TaxID=1395130 RepID=A0A6A6SGM2_9PLEO|nr:hypothetical protein P280DRAFT_545741 [Massarina eburnea CBS 473.64]
MEQHSQHRDRTGEVKAINITGTVLMVIFATWRIAVRFRINPRLGWSDYWLILAVITAIVAHSWTLAAVYAGLGRVMYDLREIAIAKKRVYYLIHVGGSLNNYAMFFAKASVCAYLLGLDFSKPYRRIIHVSIVLLVITGLILPTVANWFSCSPIEAIWDNSIEKKRCWPQTFNISVAYAQSAVNVATDLLYSVAPLIYLRRIKLTRYAQVGLRVVFMLTILGTAISMAKPVFYAEHYAALRSNIQGNPNNTFFASVTTINLSNSENSTCVVLACLPPLRRTFDNILMRILPQGLLDKIGASNAFTHNFSLPTYNTGSKTEIETSSRDGESSTGTLETDYVEDDNGRIVIATQGVTHN